MKWASTEKVQGTYTFEKADEIRALFDSWNIPLSGNTIFWEVESNIGGSKEWKQPRDHTDSKINRVFQFDFGNCCNALSSLQRHHLPGTELFIVNMKLMVSQWRHWSNLFSTMLR